MAWDGMAWDGMDRLPLTEDASKLPLVQGASCPRIPARGHWSPQAEGTGLTPTLPPELQGPDVPTEPLGQGGPDPPLQHPGEGTGWGDRASPGSRG